MFTQHQIDAIEPIQIGAGCTRRDLPAPKGLRIWVVDIEAGAAWPHVDHHDGTGEQFFVISGEVIEGDTRIGAGQFVDFAPFSEHQPRSEVGVRLLGMNLLAD